MEYFAQANVLGLLRLGGPKIEEQKRFEFGNPNAEEWTYFTCSASKPASTLCSAMALRNRN